VRTTRTSLRHSVLTVLDREEMAEFDDTGFADRRALIDHVQWLTSPPGWVFDQLSEAIELAAAGKDDAWIEVAVKNRPVPQVIEDWELEQFVELARQGEFRPRRGTESWRREPRREGELTTPWRGED
jgi:hypothetical protein